MNSLRDLKFHYCTKAPAKTQCQGPLARRHTDRQMDGRTWWLYYDKWWINWMQLVGRPDALTRRERQSRIYWPMNFISFHLISFQLAVVRLCCPRFSTRCSRSGHSVTISLYWDHGTNLSSISLVRRLAESSSASERFMWCLWKCGS